MKLARKAQEWLKLQIRRSLLLILNIVFNNTLGYRLLGWLNRKIGFLGSVFLAYPGRRDLACLYGHSLLWKWFRWRPALIGVFREGDLWGLTLAVTSVQRELCDRSNHSHLMDLLERIDKIQAILRAPHRTLAGVLPSLLTSRGVPSEGRESERAAICLEKALHEVTLREGMGEDTPIIVLGASGFVGSKLVPLLSGKQLYLVDLVPDQKTGTGSWPTHLAREASRAILVNVSTSGALAHHASRLWPGVVVLNEVYPHPSERTVRILLRKGVRIYHLSGVVGSAIPRFPGAYSGAVPCCASMSDGVPEVVLLDLAEAVGHESVLGAHPQPAVGPGPKQGSLRL